MEGMEAFIKKKVRCLLCLTQFLVKEVSGNIVILHCLSIRSSYLVLEPCALISELSYFRKAIVSAVQVPAGTLCQSSGTTGYSTAAGAAGAAGATAAAAAATASVFVDGDLDNTHSTFNRIGD